MASLKAERPAGTPSLFGQAKREPAKATEGPAKTSTVKPPGKKAEQKPREPKKKAKGGKTASKK